MVQQSKNEKKVNRKTSEEQFPKPADESTNESKDLVNQLREKIESEGLNKVSRDVLRCSVGN